MIQGQFDDPIKGSVTLCYNHGRAFKGKNRTGEQRVDSVQTKTKTVKRNFAW